MSKETSRDMKNAIKAFIEHVDSLESTEDCEGNGFNTEYRLIQDAQIKNQKEDAFSMDTGKKENNLKKNRYKDILPYDAHRVILEVVGEDPDTDYINASKLKGVRDTGGYIATQGPLALTVTDFWRMIWEKNVQIVFMACRIVENGKIKCKQYWNNLNKTEEFGNMTVTTEAEEEIMSDCIRRSFRVTKDEEVRHVIQYHYSGWPDHGIPEDPAHIRDMIGSMRKTKLNDSAPLLVHCSAGCGRTGAIIAIDYVWTLLEEGLFDEKFSLFDLICEFREQRMSLVQTPEQYALVNKVLKTLCEEWLMKMASHTYENVELDQNYYNVESNSNMPVTSGDNIYEESRDKKVQELTQEPNNDSSQEVNAGVSSIHYQNVGANDAGQQKGVQHKTIIQVSSASSKQGGQATSKGDLKHGQTSSSTWPASHKPHNAPKPPPQFLKPKSVPQEPQKTEVNALYSTPHKKNGKPPAPSPQQPPKPETKSEVEYSIPLKKNGKPPAPSPQQPQTKSEVEYSTPFKINGKPPAPSPQQPPKPETTSEVEYSIPLKKNVRSPGLIPQQPPRLAQEPVDTEINKQKTSPLPAQLPKLPVNYQEIRKLQTSPPSEDKKGYTIVPDNVSSPEATTYEIVDFSNKWNVPSSGEAGGGIRSSDSGSRTKQTYPSIPPGFNVRLPRVRGPVPMPQSWNISRDGDYSIAC